MTTSEGYNLTQTVEDLLRFGNQQMRSISRIRLVGYGLLVLALMDVIDQLIPLQLTNPIWEFQTIGNLVERVPVPLLGMVLVFFGEGYERSRLGAIASKILSWLCLLIAAFYLLMVPLGAFDTLRINQINNQEISRVSSQREEQLKQVEEQLKKGTNQDIQTVAAELTRLGVQNVDTQNPEKLRTDLLTRIGGVQQQLPEQTKQTRTNQRFILLKNSAKWLLGALISSFLFFLIWKSSRWAR